MGFRPPVKRDNRMSRTPRSIRGGAHPHGESVLELVRLGLAGLPPEDDRLAGRCDRQPELPDIAVVPADTHMFTPCATGRLGRDRKPCRLWRATTLTGIHPRPDGREIPSGVEGNLDAHDPGVRRIQPMAFTPYTTRATDKDVSGKIALSDWGVIPVGDGDVTLVADRSVIDVYLALRYRDRNERTPPPADDGAPKGPAAGSAATGTPRPTSAAIATTATSRRFKLAMFSSSSRDDAAGAIYLSRSDPTLSSTAQPGSNVPTAPAYGPDRDAAAWSTHPQPVSENTQPVLMPPVSSITPSNPVPLGTSGRRRSHPSNTSKLPQPCLRVMQNKIKELNLLLRLIGTGVHDDGISRPAATIS